jgi:hypothetical protein
MPTIQEAVNRIKQMVEEAIAISEQAKTSLIRSQRLINHIHEAVKSELVASLITPTTILPPLGVSKGEVTLSGFLKNKKQDIVVIPSTLQSVPETIISGYNKGNTDNFGRLKTERILSVNVRSQMSSLAKNVDTLFERTFAEPLNLHLRCPEMCLGEIYLIPTHEYNPKQTPVKIEKYLNAFNAISERIRTNTDHYKYEKICLLIVDFRQVIPTIYSSDQQLKADGLIPQNSTASISNLTFNQFIPSLLNTYRARFPNLL